MKNEMGFESLFDEIFPSYQIGSKKPEVSFFKSIYNKISENNTSKEEIMFWDDEIKHVKKAVEYGFIRYAYKNFENFEKVINDKSIK